MNAKSCPADALLGAAFVLKITQSCLMAPGYQSHDRLPMLGVLSKVQQRQVKAFHILSIFVVDTLDNDKFAVNSASTQTAVNDTLLCCRHSANSMLALMGLHSSAVLLKQSESSKQAASWMSDLTAAQNAMQDLLQQLHVHEEQLLSQGRAAATQVDREGAALSQLAQAVLSGISVLRKAAQCNITGSNDAGLSVKRVCIHGIKSQSTHSQSTGMSLISVTTAGLVYRIAIPASCHSTTKDCETTLCLATKFVC